MPQVRPSRHCYFEIMDKRKHKIDGWFSPKGYLHFDRPVSFKFAKSFLDNSDNVARHSFFPFITYTKSTPRYRPEERKVESKDRLIAYASHLDSQVYARYSLCLAALLERIYSDEELSGNVLAYRAIGKCNIDFANDAFRDAVQRAPCTALAFDVSAFFDTLDHGLLKQIWCSLLGVNSLPSDHFAVYKSITKFAFVDRDAVYSEFGLRANTSTERMSRICEPAEFRIRVRGKGLVSQNTNHFGIPQGSPISAVLSNAYMLPFDRTMANLASQLGGVYRRYSDDILWICPSEYESQVSEAVDKELKALLLNSNLEKRERSVFSVAGSRTVVSDQPLQYLGFTFDGERKLIRSQTLARFYRRMKFGVRSAAIAARNCGSTKIFRHELYSRFSHLGRRNFVSYGRRSQEMMRSESIRKQLKRHWTNLHAELEKYQKKGA